MSLPALPSREEFAALVAAHPRIPPVPHLLVRGSEAADLAGISYNGLCRAHRRAERAREEDRWVPGMMPEPAERDPVMRWYLPDLITWRATESRGAGGGRPWPDDLGGLLEKYKAIVAATGRPPSVRDAMRELGIGRDRAHRLMQRY